jgi:hypothetical protein
MTYLCIYSESAHSVELEKEIKDGTKVKDELEIGVGAEEIGETPLSDYDRNRYEIECRGRGGEWKVYDNDSAFSWDAVTKEVTSA